jgi:hypothetical protein
MPVHRQAMEKAPSDSDNDKLYRTLLDMLFHNNNGIDIREPRQ